MDVCEVDEVIAVLCGEGVATETAILLANSLAGLPIAAVARSPPPALSAHSDLLACVPPLLYKYRGNAAFKRGQYARAVEYYSGALECVRARAAEGGRPLQFPREPVLLGNRSNALLTLGDAARALEDAQLYVSLAPSQGKAYFRVYAALAKLGRLQEAERALLDGVDKAESDRGELLRICVDRKMQLPPGVSVPPSVQPSLSGGNQQGPGAVLPTVTATKPQVKIDDPLREAVLGGVTRRGDWPAGPEAKEEGEEEKQAPALDEEEETKIAIRESLKLTAEDQGSIQKFYEEQVRRKKEQEEQSKDLLTPADLVDDDVDDDDAYYELSEDEQEDVEEEEEEDEDADSKDNAGSTKKKEGSAEGSKDPKHT
eukprot:m51a1_g14713 hypothetical protein (371) ;mRNA; r:164248-165606